MAKSRGISTFIATLLLMVLAVAAGAIIYAYTMGYLGGLGGQKTPGTLSLDSAIAKASEHKITAYIRNIGKGTLTLDKVYVEGLQMPAANVTYTPDEEIAEGEKVKVEIIYWDLEVAKTYEVKIVCTDGTHLTFSVKAG